MDSKATPTERAGFKKCYTVMEAAVPELPHPAEVLLEAESQTYLTKVDDRVAPSLRKAFAMDAFLKTDRGKALYAWSVSGRDVKTDYLADIGKTKSFEAVVKIQGALS